MKNCDKYRTAEDRANAFDEFCLSHDKRGCQECIFETRPRSECNFAWLDLEAKEYEILNCPYCGDKCVCEKDDYDNWIVRCENCLYEMGGQEWSESEVIRRHNNVARVMLEGKK